MVAPDSTSPNLKWPVAMAVSLLKNCHTFYFTNWYFVLVLGELDDVVAGVVLTVVVQNVDGLLFEVLSDFGDLVDHVSEEPKWGESTFPWSRGRESCRGRGSRRASWGGRSALWTRNSVPRTGRRRGSSGATRTPGRCRWCATSGPTNTACLACNGRSRRRCRRAWKALLPSSPEVSSRECVRFRLKLLTPV